MRKTILYIAMSLDGYIADINGKVNWIYGNDPQINDVSSYESFINDIDTVIMGYKTYNQIVTELSPDKWVYDNLLCYV